MRSLIKTYTDDSFYRIIGDFYRNGNFHKLRNYTSSIISSQQIHGDDYKYKKEDPLYRGVRQGFITIEDYKINGVHYWPTLTSTSKSLTIAHDFNGFI